MTFGESENESRNIVEEATAERNRTNSLGAFTFHAPVPDDYAGIVLVVVALRLGDHAHLDCFSGRHVPMPDDGMPVEGRLCVGSAGRLVLRWHEWLLLREHFAREGAPIIVREVEGPTKGQLDIHVFGDEAKAT